MANHVKRASCAAAVVAAWIVGACGASHPVVRGPAPGSSSVAPPASSSAQGELPPYEAKYDSFWGAYDGEKNPLIKRAVAGMWLSVATALDGEQSPRTAAAKRAFDESAAKAGALADPCRHAMPALLWVRAQKQRLEQRWLVANEEFGSEDPKTREVDVQVIWLRDEEQRLEKLAKPCPPTVLYPGQGQAP